MSVPIHLDVVVHRRDADHRRHARARRRPLRALSVLLAVPNVSEGRDGAVLDAIGAAFAAGGARVLDRHADPDHHRAVFTLAGAPGDAARGARRAARARRSSASTSTRHAGCTRTSARSTSRPSSSATRRAARRRACAEALALADALGELGLPVFLYGVLADGRTRAELRRGGAAGLAQRMRRRRSSPTSAPRGCIRPRARCSSPRARRSWPSTSSSAPPATADDARAHRRAIREGGEEGLPGLRAIGLTLAARGDVAQVSMQRRGPRGAAARAAARGGRAPRAASREAELVGLAPQAALRRAGPSACRSATARGSSS